MGGLYDEMRQLQTDLGMRPYRVWVVTVAWSGGEIGRGEARVLQEHELLPTPLVDLRPVFVSIKSGGRVDSGTFTLREISPRYTEDQIWGMFRAEPGCQVFVEVQHDTRDGLAERRRYTVASVPWRDTKDPQWIARLSSEQGGRPRDGQLPEDETFPERGAPV